MAGSHFRWFRCMGHGHHFTIDSPQSEAAGKTLAWTVSKGFLRGITSLQWKSLGHLLAHELKKR